MSKNKHANTVEKLMWTGAEETKSVLVKNLLEAFSSNALKVERSQLEKLILITNASVDEAFVSYSKQFSRQLDVVLENVENDVRVVQNNNKKK